MTLTARAGRPLSGTAAVPGDKSCSHRALILGGMAEGTTIIHGLLESDDVLATARAVEALGATVERLGPGEWRVTGARWVAWVTGLALLGLLWVVGWLGYWLVWDQRAQQVALGSARLLDALPIFADPLGRSFLTDRSVNSLLFFVVFFVHMLLPLGMGVALWLHITRLSRPRFLPDRRMTAVRAPWRHLATSVG